MLLQRWRQNTILQLRDKNKKLKYIQKNILKIIQKIKNIWL